MRVSMLLCESAQIVDGKLYILGGGVSDLHAPVASLAVAGQLVFDSTEVNREHDWSLTLLTADGRPVALTGPDGSVQTVSVQGQAAVRTTAEPSAESLYPCTIAVTFVNLDLPDGRYCWDVEVNGASSPDWRVPFGVHSAHQHEQGAGRLLWNDPLLPR